MWRASTRSPSSLFSVRGAPTRRRRPSRADSLHIPSAAVPDALGVGAELGSKSLADNLAQRPNDLAPLRRSLTGWSRVVAAPAPAALVGAAFPKQRYRPKARSETRNQSAY